jgi:methyl-accepting chemotaxis protein
MQLKSIQLKITLWSGLCLLLAVGSFIAYSVATARSRALVEAQARALDAARLEAAKVKGQVDRAFDASRNLSQTLKAVKDKHQKLTLTRAGVNAILRKTLEENPQFQGVYTIWEPDAFDGEDAQFANTAGHDQTGRLLPHWVRNSRNEIMLEPLAGYEKEGPGDWYLVPKRLHKEALIGPFTYPLDGRPVRLSAQVVPIMVDSQFLGVVGVTLKLDYFQSLVDRVTIYQSTGQVLLVNHEGGIVSMTRQPEVSAKQLREVDPEFEKYLLSIRTGREIVKFSGNSLKVMIPVKLGLAEYPWSVCLVIPVKEIMIPINRQLWQMGGIGLVMIGLALIFLWYFAGQIAHPIKIAAKFAGQLANGIYADRIFVTSKDETGQLLNSMNDMLGNAGSLVQTREERDSLQRSIIKLLDQVSSVAEGDLTREAEVSNDVTGAIADSFNFMLAELRRIIGEVKQVTDEVTTSASQTQQATQQLAEDARTRAEEIINASQEIDAMALSIRRVAETADTSREVAHQSLATAKRGAATLQNTIAGMSQLRGQVQETAKRIKRLGEHSQEIGEIVQLISDIAYRTSVLALNASIQAARAGEAGRGFATVAEDVERLAKRSSEATKRIAELVKTTQLGAKEAIAAMEESTQGVVTGTHLIQEAGAALGEIESVSAQLAELVQGISEVAERQRLESAEVSRRMVRLSEATEYTARGIRQSAQSVNHLAALTDDLNVSVGSFKLLQSRPNSRFSELPKDHSYAQTRVG